MCKQRGALALAVLHAQSLDSCLHVAMTISNPAMAMHADDL